MSADCTYGPKSDPVRDRPAGGLEDPVRDRPTRQLEDLVRDRPAGLEDLIWDHIVGFPIWDRSTGSPSTSEDRPKVAPMNCLNRPRKREDRAKCSTEWTRSTRCVRMAGGHGNSKTTCTCACEKTRRKDGNTSTVVVGGFCVFGRKQCFQMTQCYLGLLLVLTLTVVMY